MPITRAEASQRDTELQNTAPAATPTSDALTTACTCTCAEASQPCDAGRRPCRFPPFTRQWPDLWFVQLEAIFRNYGMHSDDDRYYAAVAELDQDTVGELQDVLWTPPATGKYEQLKKHIIARFGDTVEKRLQKLFSGLTMGDRSPSQLLRHMRYLAGDNVSDDDIKIRWFDLLPPQISQLLWLLQTMDLDELAARADGVYEVVLGVCATRQGRPLSPPGTALPRPPPQRDNMDGENTAMHAMLANLIISINRVADQLHQLTIAIGGLSCPRSRARSRAQSRSRSRAASGGTAPARSSWCRYHRKFREKARNCTPPCSYEQDRALNK
ncbi:PREDICTED: uncharacterized protein LOC107074252 [Polistes dominula]|uniref:Uncharacterized protein LOC107074252 n=1 Tax=Polistes dominula TaxID=743375 RepID=A0ABM1JEV0_POLDO|nr:PREDICTED: uncharacterized protein LOC107074252 [Polistes dominula]